MSTDVLVYVALTAAYVSLKSQRASVLSVAALTIAAAGNDALLH